MRRLAFALLGALSGYAAGALLAYGLVTGLSGNTHDRGLEAVMTAAFAGGPLGALIGAVLGAIRGGHRARPATAARTKSHGDAETP